MWDFLIDVYFPLNQILLPPDVFSYKPSTKARNLVWFFISTAICLVANILRFEANINNLTWNFVKNKSNLLIININSICYKACSRGCQNSEIYLQYLYIINNIFLKKVILKYMNHRVLFQKINYIIYSYIILIVDLIRVFSHYSIFNHHCLH